MAQENTNWYRAGLRFMCSQCGDCCTGAPGFVWVTDEEIVALAELQQISQQEFQATCTRPVGTRRSLVEFANGDCLFFDRQTKKCTVYAARPRQCRTWPFWDSNLESPETWQQTCRQCPGSGQGPLVSIEQIERYRGEIKI